MRTPAGRSAPDAGLARLLQAATGADAVALVAGGARGTTPTAVAAAGYPPDVLWHATTTFPRTQWWGAVLAAPAPPVISLLPQAAFADGTFYRRHLAPAGYRDGLSMALHDGPSCVGMLHLSAYAERAFTPMHQELVADARAALARLVGGAGRPARDAPVASLRHGRCDHDPCGLPLEEGDRARLASLLRAADGLLDAPWRCTWRAGRAWHRLLLSPTPEGLDVHRVGAGLPHGLTPRELEVLTALSSGATNDAVADALVVSPRTVHTHVEHVLAKLGVENRTAAVGLAVRDGLLLADVVPGAPTDVRRLLARPGRPASR